MDNDLGFILSTSIIADRMKTKNFFNSLQIWSKRKHRIVGKYLVPFSAKVGSISTEIFCVDGFAGQGVYGDGSEGSPLLMAHVADEAAGRAKPINLKLINVEANRRNYEVLRDATKPWVARGIVTNLKGRFDLKMPEIMSAIGNSPAFVFLDPYGPGPIHLSYLRPLLERSQSITEFIINFNAEGLRRMAEFLNADPQTEQFRKTRLTSINHTTEILGRDRWKQVFSDPLIDAHDARSFWFETTWIVCPSLDTRSSPIQLGSRLAQRRNTTSSTVLAIATESS